MSRLPADYLPIDGNELFQSIGAMPPVLQVQIDIPHEYSYLFEKTYSTETIAIRRRLKEGVLARYAQAARAALWTLRQQRDAGIIPVFVRNVWLVDSVAMRYSSLSGLEYVMLVIPAAAVLVLLQKIVEEEEVEGDLLVLYAGNKAALISAASLTSGNAKVRMKKTLSQSSWGSDRLRVCQLKLRAGKESVCLGSLRVVDNIIASTTKFNLFRSGPTPKTMTQFVEVSRDTTQFPIFNGDGRTIYTAHDKFTVDTIITRDASVTAYDDVSVEVISPTGGRYTQGADSTVGDITCFGPSLVGTALYNLTTSQADQYDNSYPGQWGIINTWGWVGGGGSNDFLMQAAVAPFAEGAAYTYTINMKVPVFSQAGDVDRVEIKDAPYEGYYRYGVSGSPGEYDRLRSRFRGMELWDEDPFEGVRNGGYFAPYPFPFNRGVAHGKGFSIKYRLEFTSYVTPNNRIVEIEHPYDTEPEATGALLDDALDYLDGWLHLSNGKHVLQAFVLNGSDVRAYYDNKPVADKIAAALDIDASSIQAMILDVPISRFKSFK